MRHIVLATGNLGKVAEIQAIVSDQGICMHPQTEFGIESADETGLSFIENALIKARHAARQSGLPAIADDSGLCVDTLNGAPGIYSSRYAGPDANDETNLKRLLEALKGVPDEDRGARFICAMVFISHAEDPIPMIALGQWRGWITHEPKGSNGFGYDPIFTLENRRCTSAELPPEEKNRLSHRGQALIKLLEMLQQDPVFGKQA
ncbi:MAG: RdgB/HAM1 family non-canonical purine NTP pyrophosphatase [Gammaproteobacteria bacterium]|nr:RdgB/HAM1 family non-canonical purine NTP pyrophosphatase [Gammaproteobacteria bacterium]